MAQRAGCAAAAVVLLLLSAGLALAPVVAGHLAYPLTGRPWPRLRTVGWAIWHTWAHPGGPLQDWPAPAGRPATWLVYLITAALVTVALALVVALVAVVVKVGRGRRTVGGMATRKEEQRSHTETALRNSAANLRPVLSATTRGRELRPEQLGSYQGRSVATGQHIYQPGQDSEIVCGLTGSGKTTSKVIPSVIDWDGPQVVSSTKTDILRSTWQFAADRGGLEVFDLRGLSGGMFPALRVSPLAECDDPDVAASRSRAMIDTPANSSDNNAQFTAQGKTILRGLMHAAALEDLPFEKLLGWVYNPLSEQPASIIRRAGRGYNMYADQLDAARKQPEKQREGAYLSVRAAVDPLSTPLILTGINHRPSSCLHIRHWLGSGSGTLYLISHKTTLAGAERIVTFLIDTILDDARTLAAGSPAGRLDPMLSLWADEATNACQLASWETVLADSRGWGISAKLAIQSRALLRSTYGREIGDAIWSAANTRLMIGGGEGGNDSKELAAAFGEEEVATYSRQSGGGVTVGSRDKAVRTEANILNLPPGRAIMRAAQTPPIELELRPWWERPDANAITGCGSRYDQARMDQSTLITAHTLGTAR